MEKKPKSTLWVKNKEGKWEEKSNIGYERLKRGLSIVAEQFKVQDKFKGKRKATVNDILAMVKYKYTIDTNHESIPEITLHPICEKDRRNKNCVCGQEHLRYLSYFEIPVDGKTKKYTKFICGSTCVNHFIEDKNIDKEIRDNLREIHYKMEKATYYNCNRCGGQNYPKSGKEPKTPERLIYCRECLKELNKLKRKLKACYTYGNNHGWASYYQKKIHNFENEL